MIAALSDGIEVKEAAEEAASRRPAVRRAAAEADFTRGSSGAEDGLTEGPQEIPHWSISHCSLYTEKTGRENYSERALAEL